jgi:hypothetical protein
MLIDNLLLGGAIRSYKGSVIVITNSFFQGNKANAGGALYLGIT